MTTAATTTVIRTATAPGSDGAVYTLSLMADGTQTCSCPAFRFCKGAYKSCKHLDRYGYRLDAAPLSVVQAIAAPVAPAAPAAGTIHVFSSSGNTYIISLEAGEAVCSCPSYTYSKGTHKHCKHIAQAMGAILRVGQVPSVLVLS